jgi:hypothetical protein
MKNSNGKTDSKPKKTRSRRKFSEKTALFIRDAQGYHNVSKEFLKELSYEDAVELGFGTLLEIRTIMLDDAFSEHESFIEDVKAVVGLNNTLNELHSRFPDLMNQIRTISANNHFNNVKVFVC